MNPADRCQQRNPASGARCNRKAGHDRLAPNDAHPVDIRPHTAFGVLWTTKPKAQRVRKGK